MHCLIRRITRKTRSGVGHSDQSVEFETLSIGRGADQQVFLPDLHVALRHAVLRPASAGRFAVQARTPSGVQINGRTAQSGVVHSGDRLTVGRTEIRLKKPPRGYDLLLEIDAAPAQAASGRDVGPVTLAQAGLHKRRWAWVLFLLIIGFGLAIPMLQVQERAPSTPEIARFLDTEVIETERIPWHSLGGDRLWDSGPMSRPHRFFGNDCASCHERPFQRVTNAACLDCHEGLPHHASDPALLEASGLGDDRCASCHLEHNGPDGLIATDSTLCTDCHRAPQRRMPGTSIEAVAGFEGRSHPQFRIRVLGFDPARAETGPSGYAWQRVRMDGPLSEENGLAFPHDVHLDDAGIEGPDGREQLDCSGCHEPGPEGVAMQPVRFEDDCQRCHRLDFEPNEPRRQLPHGEPEVVVSMLEEYYARVALAGGYRTPSGDPPDIVRQRRPADEALSDRERRVALAWASERAREVSEEVFEYRTCKTCHEIERRPDAPGGWHVRPVVLTQDWYEQARFTHEPHRQAACTDCHAAQGSSTASDVLMPGIAVCQDCHGETFSQDRIATRCVDCHGFHTDTELRMDDGIDSIASSNGSSDAQR